MWWGGVESPLRGFSGMETLGVGGGSVGTGFIGGIEVGMGPGLDEFCLRELTDSARDLLVDTSACREAKEGAGDGVLGGGVLEDSPRSEGEETISWTRWARRFDKDGPLVEGEGGGPHRCPPSSWIGTGLLQSEHLTVGRSLDILPSAGLGGGRREAIDDGSCAPADQLGGVSVGGGEQVGSDNGRRIGD